MIPKLPNLRLAVALFIVAATGAGSWAQQATLPKNSPFMPPAGAAGPSAAASETIEFTGMSSVGQRIDLIFHDKSTKKNHWIGIGETKEGIANLDAICATPGLDAVYIGPADLSFALGLAPRADNPDPLHIATCDKIRVAAHKAGIKCVMHCAAAPFAAGAVKRGFDMVMLTSDASCMAAGAKAQLEELKAKSV